MKSLEQVLGFIEGWELAISTNDEEQDKDNQVLNTLKEIWAYICLDVDSSICSSSSKEERTELTEIAPKQEEELPEGARLAMNYIHIGDMVVFYEDYKGKRNKAIGMVKGFDFGEGEVKTSAPRFIWGKTYIDGTWYGDWASGTVFYRATPEEEREFYANVPDWMVPSIEKLLKRQIRTK